MIIYKSTNTINNKCYIGQTIQRFNKRKRGHKYNSGKQAFAMAIRKHGWDNFTWEVLCECSSKEELDEMEFHYIKQYDSYRKGGYNMTMGGEGGMSGFNHTEETKEKCRIASTGVKVSKETRRKLSILHKGRKHTDESKKRMGLSQKGRKHTDESKKKMSISKSKPRKPLTDDHKKNCSISQLNRTDSLKPCVFIDPNGVEYLVKGIKPGCRYHKLRSNCMSRVLNGKQKTHQGWTARYIN